MALPMVAWMPAVCLNRTDRQIRNLVDNDYFGFMYMRWTLVFIVAAIGLLWLSNPDELQHKVKVKQLMIDYIAKLNAPWVFSGDAD